jgi:hypothetical protein
MPVYLLIVMAIHGGLEVVELPVPSGPVACSMSAQLIAADWIAQHRPGATIRRLQCRMGHPA